MRANLAGLSGQDRVLQKMQRCDAKKADNRFMEKW